MLRAFAGIIFAVASLSLATCDKVDPFGFYPEPAREITAPLELTGRVVDAADVLTNEEEHDISESLAAIEQDTLAQLVVVTTPNLDGHSISDYSLALGRGWGIGDAKRNDGLLLVIAPNERKVRIEVGYGLEETVEDPEAAEIMREIIPFFKEGNMPGGIKKGVELLERELREPKVNEAA